MDNTAFRPRSAAFIRPADRSAIPVTDESKPSPSLITPERFDRGKSNRSVRFLDGFVTASIAMMFFGTPLFFTGVTLQGIAFEKQLFFYFWLLLGVVVWVIKGMVVGELKVRRTFLDVPLGIFVVVYVGSAFLSVDWWRSFWGPFNDPSRGVLGIVALVLMYYLILSHFNPKRFVIWFSALLVSSLLLLIWTLLAFFGVRFLPVDIEQYAPLSLFGTVTNLALYLMTIIPLIVVAIMKAYNIRSLGRVLAVILGIMLLAILVLSLPLNNYIPWPAVLVGIGLFAIYVLAQVVNPGENWSWLPMLVLVLVLSAVMFGEANFLKVQLPVEASPNWKLSWDIAKSGLQDNFFLGSGPGTYAYDFSLYRPVEYNLQPLSQLRFFQGRGLVAEFLPTIGVVGTFLFIALLLSFLGFGLYLLSHNREYNKVYSLGFWSAIVVLVIGVSLVSTNSSLITIGSLIAILGLAVLFWESRVEATHWNLSLKVSPKYALVSAFIFLVASAGIIFLFTFIGKSFVADVLANRSVVKARETGDTGVVTSTMGQAVAYMPRESQYRAVLGRVYLALANAEANKPADIRDLKKLAEYVNASTTLLEAAKAISPNDIGIQEILAQTYESKLVLAGPSQPLLDPLQVAYERARDMEPNNPVFFLKLGQIQQMRASTVKDQERTNLLNKAKEYFQQSIEKQKNFAPGYLNLALTEEALGASKDIILEELQKGWGYDQKNSDILYHMGRIYRLRGDEDDLKQAEAIFSGLLKVNEKDPNYRLNLAMTYEAMKQEDDAIEQYRTLLDATEGDDDNAKAVRKQLQTMIDNVRAGKSNLTASVDTGVPSSVPTVPSAPAVQPQQQESPVLPQP